MTAVAQKTVLTGCLAPIDKGGLEQLIANGKANPKVIKTLKCKTVAEGKFRHANYIRNLAPYIVDEPPGLLGDDTAPNPSEASLAALGSCLAVGLHANAVHRGWIVNKLELELEGDLNITAVWGTGDVSEKPVGFTDVRVKVDMECEGVPQDEIDALVTHVKKWSPVANTFTRPVNLEVGVAAALEANRVRRDPWVRWHYRGSQLRSASTFHRRSRSRGSRARSSHRWRPPSTRARSIPTSAARPRRVGAWGSHRPAGMARPICAAPSSRSQRSARSAAPPLSWRGARTRWSGTPPIPAIRSLRRDSATSLPAGKILGGTGLSNPMKTLLRDREAQAERPQGRGRLRRQGRAALGLQSRPRPFLRHHLRARGRARRHRDVPRRLLRSRDHAAALQAVPRHGRHRHLWRAVPRRVRAR